MSSKNSLVAASGVYALVGLILIFFPNRSLSFVCTLAGILMVGYGVVAVIGFFAGRGTDAFAFRSDLVLGVMAGIVGIFFLLHSDFIISVIPTILGVYILIDALMNMKRGLDLRELGYAGWTTTLVLSGISLAMGLVILWNPFKTGLILWRVIGGVFLYLGASDLWSVLKLDKLLRGE